MKRPMILAALLASIHAAREQRTPRPEAGYKTSRRAPETWCHLCGQAFS